MGPLNSGRSHQAAAGLAPRQPAIQVSSDRAEALADKLDITFDPGRARLPSPAGQRWLDCRFGSSSAETGSLLPGIPAPRHSSAFDWGSVGEPAPPSRVIALGRIRSCDRALSGAIVWSPERSSVRRELEHESARAGSGHVAASPGGAGVRSGRRRALPTRPAQPRNRRRCGRHQGHAQRKDAQDACDWRAVPKGFGVWAGRATRWWSLDDHSTSARVPSIIAAGRRGRRARGDCPRAPPGSRALRRRL